MQPEGSGSIDGALLGLRYLNTLTSIANRHTRDHQHVLDIPPASTEQTAVEQLSMQSTVRQEGCDSSPTDHRVIYPDVCLRECSLYGDAAELPDGYPNRLAWHKLKGALHSMHMHALQEDCPLVEPVAAPSRGCLLLAHPLLT